MTDTSLPPVFLPTSPPPQPAPGPPGPDLTRFNQLVTQNELQPHVANQLYTVLSSCDIVLLCDDSDSMNKSIAEEGTDPFAPKRSTRWTELKKLASIIIEFVTAINPAGLDIYFLNRPKICGVTNTAGLQAAFSTPPCGGTPLNSAINHIYHEKAYLPITRSLLIVVITDGEPTDATRDQLYYTLVNKRDNVHVSFAETTDNAEDCEYLDAWDGRIKNFDNTDDYREELARVKQIQGPQFKFDFTDYVIKILLATFVRWYFNLDQVKVSNNAPLPALTRQYMPPQPIYSPVYQNYQNAPPGPVQSGPAPVAATVSTAPISSAPAPAGYRTYPTDYQTDYEKPCCCNII